jgi:hypothetical protein
MLKAGYVGGKHFTEYVEKVKTLKRNGENEKAIKLLLKLVSATEKESNKNQMGVAPWYYEQLAILYKKAGKIDEEYKILYRFSQQKHALGVTVEKLLKRLEKVSMKIAR